MTPVQTIRLSELALEVQKTINNVFANRHFWVIAEVTSYSFQSQKNHHYFDLVEKSETGVQIMAKMQTAAWLSGNNSIRNFERLTGQKFKNDIQILAKVSVDFHSTFGLKLILHDVDINFTIGALEKQKQETLARLLAECSGFISKVGDLYITNNKKLRLPSVIQNIAIVTSSQSAGLHDFIHTIESNSFGYNFHIKEFYTVVQGEAKAELVYNKLLEVFNSGLKFDVVVIIRGGGSQTDFLIFDQFILGKIVAKFPIPILTGIGHQKNETIVDLMANAATKTPTKCAEFIIAHNRAFEEKVLTLQKSIIIRSQHIFTKNSQQLASINSIIVNNTRTILNTRKDKLMNSNQVIVNKSKELLFKKQSSLVSIASNLSSKPKILVSTRLNQLSNILDNIRTFKGQYLKNQRGYLGHFISLIKTISPENILKKGFAIVKVRGNITSNPDHLKPGEEMSIILSNKEIKSIIKSKTDYNGSDFNI